MKLKSVVPAIGEDGVKWLIIESDENDTSGFFLYYYMDDHAAYDTWHKTLEDAYEAAYMQYGVVRENWEEITDV
ncbi:hypothetical protein [Niabella aurantiaca]|uniref:hypothetical protein n=1 Tax=Niabella aurantiaca TaxID=379900 RepID=UPI00035CA6EC|nr:hypothetical protein [Niabella aurantiaca]